MRVGKGSANEVEQTTSRQLEGHKVGILTRVISCQGAISRQRKKRREDKEGLAKYTSVWILVLEGKRRESFIFKAMACHRGAPRQKREEVYGRDSGRDWK